jgi:YVTN family beta-propeller protein
VTHGLGYVVHVDPGQLDATDFADLVDSGRDALHAGRPREASDRLRQALGLWRGAALAGMSDEPFARSCAARLEDLRLAAVELRIEADLSLHRHTSLVGELDTLVAEHPYREGFQRQLMLALYRSGRQADALAAYRSTRQRLVNELGVEPSRELKELHAAILRQDPALAPPDLPRLPRKRTRVWVAAAAMCAATLVAAVGVATVVSRPGSQPALVVVPDSLVEIDPADNVVAQVTPVGRQPDQVAFGAGAAWVVNVRDRTVSKVRPGGDVDTIGGVPRADHVVVDGEDVWVSSFDRSSVARIDAGTAEVVETLGVPSRHAEGLAVGGGYLWITNPATRRAQGVETVSLLDLRSREVVSTIPVGKTPIFTTFGYGAVWVANYDGGSVSVIRPGSSAAESIAVCEGPLGIATGYGSVWVVCYWRRRLVRIDANTRRILARIRVGDGPLSVATGAGGVWVTNRRSHSVTRVDPRTNTVAATIRFRGDLSPYGVAVGGGGVWVSVARCLEPWTGCG